MTTTVYRPATSSSGDSSITGDLAVTGDISGTQDLTVDTNTLFVDSVNNRVGVVNLTPGVPLDVVGNIRSSTGILFGADTAAANLLDDYEENTFLPTVQDDNLSDGEGQTYSVQLGFYTKIGRVVHAHGRIVITSLGTLTTSHSARLAGLPYQSVSTSGYFSSLICGRASGVSITAGNSISGYAGASSTRVDLVKWSETTGFSALLLSELTAGGDLMFSITYITA